MRTTDPSLLDAFMCTSSTSQAAAMLVSADIPFPGMDVTVRTAPDGARGTRGTGKRIVRKSASTSRTSIRRERTWNCLWRKADGPSGFRGQRRRPMLSREKEERSRSVAHSPR